MEPQDAPEVMNRQQCADYLNVGTATIDRWRRTEGLPFVKIGESNSTTRYRRSAVAAWFAERERANAVARPVHGVVRRQRQHL